MSERVSELGRGDVPRASGIKYSGNAYPTSEKRQHFLGVFEVFENPCSLSKVPRSHFLFGGLLALLTKLFETYFGETELAGNT